jgi:hypothetical protein
VPPPRPRKRVGEGVEPSPFFVGESGLADDCCWAYVSAVRAGFVLGPIQVK